MGRIGMGRSVQSFYYDETNGGGDVAIPAGGALTPLLHLDGSQVGFTITVPSDAPAERWWLHGSMLVRADSANDTPIKVHLRTTGGTDLAVWHSQRAYYGGSANLQAWWMANPRRMVTLSPGSYALRLYAECPTGFGGLYHRGDPVNGGYLAAERV